MGKIFVTAADFISSEEHGHVLDHYETEDELLECEGDVDYFDLTIKELQEINKGKHFQKFNLN